MSNKHATDSKRERVAMAMRSYPPERLAFHQGALVLLQGEPFWQPHRIVDKCYRGYVNTDEGWWIDVDFFGEKTYTGRRLVLMSTLRDQHGKPWKTPPPPEHRPRPVHHPFLYTGSARRSSQPPNASTSRRAGPVVPPPPPLPPRLPVRAAPPPPPPLPVRSQPRVPPPPALPPLHRLPPVPPPPRKR